MTYSLDGETTWLDASDPLVQAAKIEVFDANGKRLEHVVSCNIDTGYVESIRVDPIGNKLYPADGRNEARFVPAPLKAYSKRTGARITSILQLWGILGFSRLENQLDQMATKEKQRQNIAFTTLSMKNNRKLGTPRFDMKELLIEYKDDLIASCNSAPEFNRVPSQPHTISEPVRTF